MKRCEQFEALLWDYSRGDLGLSESEAIEKHLSECDKCGQTLATFKAVGESAAATREKIAVIDSVRFDDMVIRKIRSESRPSNIFTDYKRYYIRMAMSVGLAAAIVIFMIMSISDLDKLNIPSPVKTRQKETPEKTYDRIEISLNDRIGADKKEPQSGEKQRQPLAFKPAETPESGEMFDDGNLLLSKEITIIPENPIASHPEKVNLPIETPSVAAEKEDISSNSKTVASKDKSRIDRADISASSTRLIAASPSGGFSFLDSPVANPAPESVSISAVYISDEAVPELSQQTRALISEVVIDTGMIQTANPPRGVLVTVEKMPVATMLVTPEYPTWAMKRGISGLVWVKARLNENGDVESAKIISSSFKGVGFEEAVMEAALKSKYKPAEANGSRIPVWIVYPVEFVYTIK